HVFHSTHLRRPAARVQRKLRRRGDEPRSPVERAKVSLTQILLCVETFDLAAERAAQARRAEEFHGADAATALAQRRVQCGWRVAERRDDARACDDDALHLSHLALPED